MAMLIQFPVDDSRKTARPSGRVVKNDLVQHDKHRTTRRSR
jgi:hypothetical protein